ncbi:alanine--tRNA ligase [Tritonibacter mobilis]|nr:alanine--tRNA ligase [Tritonibacter mobilis]
MPSLNDIRSTFLNYFAKQGHEVVDSSPLVPRNDPTLMFTNSGMVQFKNCFTGVDRRDYVRATTAQKCVRAGGKHNDLDNVGYTARHHTFFEMLGNFSFGDYFKNEAIPFAWELITGEFDIPKDKLYTTVYHTDDEAFEIWKKVGVPEERIIRIATSDNFWQMGDTGPCGPCTEIFYDHGDHIWGGPPGSPEEDGDRFIEIWNLVFMQNERFADGSMVDLDMQSIDTGMGLERIAALLQGTHDNYETDLFKYLIEASATVTKSEPYGDQNVHHRVIADHLRSCSFLIAEGVLPSNEGRGYVLRRIMRRAMRHASLLGATDPVMHKLVPALVSQMGAAYPELGQGQALIEETFEQEETRFLKTLDRGLKLLDDASGDLEKGDVLPGETAFKLYDTFGFPLDLTQDALRAKGIEVDTDGFDAAMKAQKEQSRAGGLGLDASRMDAKTYFDIVDEFGPTEFLGYETETAEGQILAIIADGERFDSASEGQEFELVLNQTPFYAESGGQVGDRGIISVGHNHIEISDTKKFEGLIIHFAKLVKGEVKTGDNSLLEVDHARRSQIRANHSATHLLHEALRNALGDHVAQKGSLNAADRLRFDFSHNKAVSAEDLSKISAEVNDFIRQNSAVSTRIMTPDDARALGAQALFGEKYGEEVRVVSMGRAPTGKGADGETYSIELCGGTHVKQTGDIGTFVILGDSASSAGVRRIEALTGAAAFAHLEREAGRMAEVAASLKAQPADVMERLKALMDERKALQNEIATLKQQIAMGDGAGGGAETKEIGGKTFLGQALQGVSGKDLRGLIDAHKQKIGSGVILLIAEDDGKVAVAAGVTDDLTGEISAVDVLKAAVPAVGGKGGGGRPDMAQGGGKDFSGADEAIKAAEALLKG